MLHSGGKLKGGAPEGISALVTGRNILLLRPASVCDLSCLAMLESQVLQLVLSSMTGGVELIEVLATPLAGLGCAS